MFKRIPANNISISGRRTILGVGINDADYLVKPTVNGKKLCCPIYRAWIGMITRCYSEKTHKVQPLYKDCTVHIDWLLFSTFKKWAETKDYEGNELDKDIVKTGNKVYSADTCLFVSKNINTFVCPNKSRDNGFPCGVDIHKATGKYRAQSYFSGKNHYIGIYATAHEAREAYVRFKCKKLELLASQQTSSFLSSCLLRISGELIDTL
tara:strand:+ start:192 stop:815 length:624 start_codon:yes stop_codon:yes gene_type:complete